MIKTGTLRGIEKEANKYALSNLREFTITLALRILEDGVNHVNLGLLTTLLGNEKWDEILPFITFLCQSNEIRHKETALLMIANLISCFQDQFKGPNFTVLIQILKSGLSTTDQPQVHVTFFFVNSEVGACFLRGHRVRHTALSKPRRERTTLTNDGTDDGLTYQVFVNFRE